MNTSTCTNFTPRIPIVTERRNKFGLPTINEDNSIVFGGLDNLNKHLSSVSGGMSTSWMHHPKNIPASHSLSSASTIKPSMITSTVTSSAPTIPPMIEKRCRAAVATINDNSFVVIGGRSNDIKPLSSSEVYDGRTNKWSRLPQDMSDDREYCAAVTIGRHIYVVGGSKNYKALSTMVTYSLERNNWIVDKILNKPMKQPRFSCSAVASNGRLYVFGGVNKRVLNTSEVYNPVTNMWKNLPRMSQGRRAFATVTINDKIYVMGGFGEYGHLSSVEIFDISSEKWEKGPDMPKPLYGHAAVIIGKSIIVIGGRNCDHKQFSSTLIYNINEKKWADGPSMISARVSHMAVTNNKNRVIIAGGYNSGGYINTAEIITFELDSTTRTWHQNENNETNSLISRAKVIARRLGITFEGSLMEMVEKMEKEMYGSIREGRLINRLEKLENDIIFH